MSDEAPNPSADSPTLDYPRAKVGEVLDKYLEDVQNGRACTREELLKAHPDLKDELTEYLNSIEMVAGLGVGDELLVQQLGDFEIIKPIGCGAMGIVYLANQKSLNRQVALKVLRYTVIGEQATKRFEREAELVATLRHANIVPIYTTGKQDGSHYLAMRLVDGPSLSHWSAEQNVDRDPKQIAGWGAQVAHALAHAHQRDVIHRDVKPSNLLIEDDHVWLSDFGLARRFDDLRMSMTGAMLGTPNYMSPEQAAPARQPIDHRSDIYSLGATLFELLTGRCVYLADTPHAVLAQVIAEEPPRLGEVLPEASRDLETILLKCLEKDPASRYQNALQLAEDLEAFSEDRSIKARRPNPIERFTRWKRKNQKLVSTAMITASAAVMLLGISIAIWMAWQDSITGSIEIASNEGPIVGRLIDEQGNASPTFTIPTEIPVSIAAGQHTLQTWSGGRLGESQQITVTAGTNQKLATKLSQNGVFDERTVKGIPLQLPLDDRDDLLFFHAEGITRMDGRSGKELWTANAKQFIEKIQQNSSERLTAKIKKSKDADSTSTDQIEAPVQWSLPLYMQSFSDDRDNHHNDQSIPVLVEGFPDINTDGVQDVLIACRTQAVLLAFNGKNGNLLWSHNAGKSGWQSKTLHQPIGLGDIDGDTIEDFAYQFYNFKINRKSPPTRWMAAVSGKTGKRIWNRSIPSETFDTPANMTRPPCCQVGGTGCHFQSVTNPRSGWRYRTAPWKAFVDGELVPWAPTWAESPNSENGKQLLVACGSKIISCDPTTGKAGSFNDGVAFELGFIPALQPQVVQTFDKEKGKIVAGLFLTEIVKSKVGKNGNIIANGSKPITRYSLRSVETGNELWRFDADYETKWWPDTRSNWPVIVDVNGDSQSEILIADGTDLENRRPSGFASLQALDAQTGKPLWDANQRAKIRTLDRQIQHALLGPDEDGDGLGDIYVVSPMVQSKCWIFIDIVSGVTGERLRSVRSEIPVFPVDNITGIAIQKPAFIENASGHPGLVIVSKGISANNKRHSTVVMSTETGELLSIGDHLEHPIMADGDGDGSDDLFLLKPRDRSKPLRSNQLVSLKSASGGIRLVVGEANFSGEPQLTPMEDVDSDGVRDLLHSHFGHYLANTSSARPIQRRVISGSTGKNLVIAKARRPASAFYPIHRDLNNDGVKDFLSERRTGDNQETYLTLISGADCRAL